MTLEFLEDEHKYFVDGKEVPSVSEIIRFISREVYGEIDDEILQNAADRGTAIHKACEVLDEYGIVECDSEILPYLMAYKNFLEEHEVEWELIEKSLLDVDKRYAGTIDRYGVVDGLDTLLDIKTTGIIKKPIIKAQLTGYNKLLRSGGRYPDMVYCLQLKPDGKYKLYLVDVFDDTEFNCCLELHKALNKKHARGRID